MEKPPLESFLIKSPLQKEDLEPEISAEKIIEKLRGPRGYSGKAAEAPSVEFLESLILPLIPKPLKGFDGKDGKSVEINELLPIIENLIPAPLLPSIEDIEAIVLPLIPEPMVMPELAPKDLIEKINKAKTIKIKKERVEGLDELEGLARSANRNVQNFISLGGARNTRLQLNGVMVATGANTINFIGGTLTPVGDGTTVNYTPPSSGGGSGYQVPTGTVNGTNQTFTWATAPNVIVVDQGRAMQKVSSDGTVNWTGTTTTILSIAPTFDIYATN